MAARRSLSRGDSLSSLVHRSTDNLVLVSIGTIVPDTPEFRGLAFSRAAQMFQEGLVEGLAGAGLPADLILGLEPTPTFPRGKMFGRAGKFTTVRSGAIRLLPFINVHPLKWLTAGLSVFLAIVWWSWRHRQRSRVVHCVNLTMPPGIFIWLAARLTGSRTLVSVLDVFLPGGALAKNNLYQHFDFSLQRWLMPRFDGLMVVSSAIAQDFVPGRYVCRVEGGVQAEVFTARPGTEASRSGGKSFRVVLSGSLEPYNGASVALDAFSLLPHDYELVIAGKGTLEQEVRARAAADPRVRYLGFLDFAEVLDLYRSADLLLNLRLTRAWDMRYFFPSKLMELLASGVPVLSTLTGHVEEEYGHALYLLNDESPKGLAERIQEIAGHPPDHRRGLGERARKFMLEEKTWAAQGRKLAQYIRAHVVHPAPKLRP